MRESEIERYLVKRVKEAGGVAKKMHNRNDPDRIVLWCGGFADFVELKALGKKPRKAQDREHHRLRKLEFSVFVIDSKDAVDYYINEVRSGLRV